MNTRRGRSVDGRRARAGFALALGLGFLTMSGGARAQEPPASESTAPPSPAATPSPAAGLVHVPPRIETEPRQGLIVGGAVTWAVAYAFSLSGSSASDGDTARHWLYVPVAGPFLFLANRAHCNNPEPGGCVDDFVTPMVFTMFGVTQVIGAALAAGGFLFPRERVVVTPTVVGQSGLGVAAAGTLF